MSPISIMTLVLALVMLTIYMMMILKPALFRKGLADFPRSVWPARVLTAIDAVWATTVLHYADFGGFNWIKTLLTDRLPFLAALSLGPLDCLKDPIVLIGILTFFLIIKYMRELLAPRALGGLMLLIANPMLNAARWLETPWRLVIVIVAYIIVIKGILLVLSPFRLRKWSEKFIKNDEKCRIFGFLGAIFAIFLGFLGVFVF